MLLIIGTVRLPSENLKNARISMQQMVDASRAEDGCAEYVYAEDLFDAGLIHIKELWRDQEALNRHFESEHIKVWRETWPIFGIGERNLKLYDLGEPRDV